MVLMANETCKSATLTANSSTVNYPASNVLDSRLSRIFRTVALTTTATIVFDALAAVTVDSVVIANHNITTGGTYKVQGNATDSWGAPSVDETITFASGNMTKQFTGGSYRYWRISIINATNPDTYIEIGRVWLGDAFTMPDISPTLGHSRNSKSIKSISVSGQSYQDTRYFDSQISVKFPKVSTAEKANLITQFETIDTGVPFFVTFDESNISLGTIYVTLDQDSFNFNLLNNPKYWETALSLQEEV